MDRIPALVFSGDKSQMAGFGEERPWECDAWKNMCFERFLGKAFRCKDNFFWSQLETIRTKIPTKTEVNELCAGHKAWDKTPTHERLLKVLDNFPHTTILTCTRNAAHKVNMLVLDLLFKQTTKKLVTLRVDPFTDPRNYEQGKVKPVKDHVRVELDIYVGMQLYITANLNKKIDFCNGMRVNVEEYDKDTRSLRVKTVTNKQLMIYPWYNKNYPGTQCYYPIRPGYASTIMKFQGATLKHVTIWLDIPGIKGAAYTGLSRVARNENYLLAGDLKPEHFVPAAIEKKDS
jgi:hypothetical protein